MFSGFNNDDIWRKTGAFDPLKSTNKTKVFPYNKVFVQQIVNTVLRSQSKLFLSNSQSLVFDVHILNETKSD